MDMNTTASPRLSTAWWGITLRIFVAIVVMLAANVARVPLHELVAGRWSATVETPATAVIFGLTAMLIVAFVWGWMRWVERRPIGVLRVGSLRAAGLGLLGGTGIVGVAMAATWIYGWLAGLSAAANPAGTPSGTGDDLAALPLGVAPVLLVARSFVLQGIPEELLFRGWLWDVLRDRPWVAFVWVTVGFTLPHLLSAGGQEGLADHLVYLLIPLGMSGLGGAVVLRCGNFWWAAGTHGGVHLWLGILSAAWPLELGPHLWVAIGVAQIVAAAIVLATGRGRLGSKPRRVSSDRA